MAPRSRKSCIELYFAFVSSTLNALSRLPWRRKVNFRVCDTFFLSGPFFFAFLPTRMKHLSLRFLNRFKLSHFNSLSEFVSLLFFSEREEDLFGFKERFDLYFYT